MVHWSMYAGFHPENLAPNWIPNIPRTPWPRRLHAMLLLPASHGLLPCVVLKKTIHKYIKRFNGRCCQHYQIYQSHGRCATPPWTALVGTLHHESPHRWKLTRGQMSVHNEKPTCYSSYSNVLLQPCNRKSLECIVTFWSTWSNRVCTLQCRKSRVMAKVAMSPRPGTSGACAVYVVIVM